MSPMHAYYIVSCKTPLMKCGVQAQFFYVFRAGRALAPIAKTMIIVIPTATILSRFYWTGGKKNQKTSS